MTKAICLLMCLITSFSLQAKDTIYLYTYHKKPPFIVDLDSQQGLYFDLAESLSDISVKYKFETVFVPRKRLNVLVEKQALDGLVVGVLPVWFKDKNESKYLWSGGFYPDRDEFVSLNTLPFEYKGKSSLQGKIVGSVAGHYYREINEAVKVGDLLRIDTVGELEVLQLIEKQRVDFGLVSQSVFKYLRKNQNIQDIFHTSTIPHDQFSRRAFTTPNHSPYFDEFTLRLQQLMESGELTSLINKYQ